MKRSLTLTLIAVALALVYGGRLAWRAHQDLVSLEANDITVVDVVKKLRWQTWEDIELGKDVNPQARVTFRVKDQPLEAVLELVSEQVGSRWVAAYPLYTTQAKLAVARKLALGTLQAPQFGWTNWNARPNFGALAAMWSGGATNAPTPSEGGGTPPAGGPGLMGGFGGPDGGGPVQPVTVEWKDTPPLVAAASLRRFGQVKVVPEDGTLIKVNLQLKEVPMDKAVAQLAKKVNRKWAKFYLIGEARGPRPEPREQTQQRPDFNPEQMRERFQQIAASPEFQQRMEQRENRGLLNSTPDQRAERDRRRARGPGRGGGGGPGR